MVYIRLDIVNKEEYETSDIYSRRIGICVVCLIAPKYEKKCPKF